MPFPLHLTRLTAAVSAFALSLHSPRIDAKEIPYLWGMDVSALTVFEEHGAVYRDAEGEPGDPLHLLREAGANCFRLRLFVDPTPEGIVTNDLPYTLELARRIKASGAQFLLDLHYSDTWADPAKQFKPKTWESLDFDALTAIVERYTAEILQRFRDEGLTPDYVQLGNEITNGLLWPDGRVEFAEKEDTDAWKRLGELLRAADRGFRAAFAESGSIPIKLLHIESTGNLERTAWYLHQADAQCVTYDLLGFSFYPEWHGSIEDLQKTLNAAAAQSGRPVVVVETAYPWKDGERWNDIEHLDWPRSREGQREFIRAVHAAVRAVPENQGRGVFWWHPESILTDDLFVWLGGACALFDDEGRILPAATLPAP